MKDILLLLAGMGICGSLALTSKAGWAHIQSLGLEKRAYVFMSATVFTLVTGLFI